MTTDFSAKLKFNDQGLLPAIVQDANTKEVLMMAWMNKDAVELTIETKRATFFSVAETNFG